MLKFTAKLQESDDSSLRRHVLVSSSLLVSIRDTQCILRSIHDQTTIRNQDELVHHTMGMGVVVWRDP